MDLLAVLSALFAFGFFAFRLPAALLLGPMLGAIVVAASGGTTRLPLTPFYAAQAVIGCMIADKLPISLIGEVGRNWPIFLGGVVSVIVAASLLGWLLARWRVLPGATAVWGSAPGAATVMTLMSESYGVDMRLVALMQYLRVVCCAVVASLVARVWATGGGTPAATVAWFAPTPLAARRRAGADGDRPAGRLEPAHSRRRDADAARAWPRAQRGFRRELRPARVAARCLLRRRRLGHRGALHPRDHRPRRARAAARAGLDSRPDRDLRRLRRDPAFAAGSIH